MKTLQYKTPQHLAKALNKYLDDHTGADSKFMPSIAGLLRNLKLSRQGFVNYKKRPGYAEVIESAIITLAADIEEGILNGNYRIPAGIFLLKVLGYREARGAEIGSIGESIGMIETEE